MDRERVESWIEWMNDESKGNRIDERIRRIGDPGMKSSLKAAREIIPDLLERIDELEQEGE